MISFVLSLALIFSSLAIAAPVESGRDTGTYALTGRVTGPEIEKEDTSRGQSSQQRADAVKAAFDFAWDGYYK